MKIRLHDYWRSGAAYRVRIALALKGLEFESVAHDLRLGEQTDPSYLAIAPIGFGQACGQLAVTINHHVAAFTNSVLPSTR